MYINKFSVKSDNTIANSDKKANDLGLQVRMLKAENAQLKKEISLLKEVESIQKERAEFVKTIGELKKKCADSEATINSLTASCESYKRDCLIATELLHADPSRFLPVNPDNSTFKAASEVTELVSIGNELH
ncbi:hypothetical protein ACTXT7_006531 [Hymenolepis weldensis]